ncbi:MAG: hypothetical protein LV481_16420 [Methylacidiphilales bacterium]|nr:hypothetical protein [Candidatus Methylacidiphilales bacterium]
MKVLALSVAIALSFGLNQTALATCYCWVDARTGKPVPTAPLSGANTVGEPRHAAEAGVALMDGGNPNAHRATNSKTGEVYVTYNGHCWFNEKTGEPVLSAPLAPANLVSDPDKAGDAGIIQMDALNPNAEHATNLRNGQVYDRVPCQEPGQQPNLNFNLHFTPVPEGGSFSSGLGDPPQFGYEPGPPVRTKISHDGETETQYDAKGVVTDVVKFKDKKPSAISYYEYYENDLNDAGYEVDFHFFKEHTAEIYYTEFDDNGDVVDEERETIDSEGYVVSDEYYDPDDQKWHEINLFETTVGDDRGAALDEADTYAMSTEEVHVNANPEAFSSRYFDEAITRLPDNTDKGFYISAYGGANLYQNYNGNRYHYDDMGEEYVYNATHSTNYAGGTGGVTVGYDFRPFDVSGLQLQPGVGLDVGYSGGSQKVTYGNPDIYIRYNETDVPVIFYGKLGVDTHTPFQPYIIAGPGFDFRHEDSTLVLPSPESSVDLGSTTVVIPAFKEGIGLKWRLTQGMFIYEQSTGSEYLDPKQTIFNAGDKPINWTHSMGTNFRFSQELGIGFRF